MPSALLVAVTAHISTDIAAIPLLWIVPLALYLVTFVIAFQRKPIIPHRLVLKIVPLLIAPLTISAFRGGLSQYLLAGLALHLEFSSSPLLPVTANWCVGDRTLLISPAFYLSMSFGGVLGGIFSGLLAPAIFSSVLEYPILIVAALVCLPAFWTIERRVLTRDLAIGAAITVTPSRPPFTGLAPTSAYGMISLLVLVFGIGAIVLTRAAPAMHLAIVIGLMALSAAYQPQAGKTETHRSFFGVNKIIETLDGRFRLLVHGTTLHGAERIRNDDGTPYSGPPKPADLFLRRRGARRRCRGHSRGARPAFPCRRRRPGDGQHRLPTASWRGLAIL